MEDITRKAANRARQLGICLALSFAPSLLVPEERIREFCRENKCGNYNSNYTCPPFVGDIEEIKERIGQFRHAVLLQYSKSVVIRKGSRELRQTKVDFHRKILQLEDFLKGEGIRNVWGMPGGSCGLCSTCQAAAGEPCSYPDQARSSLEALGIDVLSLLRKLGLDDKFYPDRITWTGCVLF